MKNSFCIIGKDIAYAIYIGIIVCVMLHFYLSVSAQQGPAGSVGGTPVYSKIFQNMLVNTDLDPAQNDGKVKVSENAEKVPFAGIIFPQPRNSDNSCVCEITSE